MSDSVSGFAALTRLENRNGLVLLTGADGQQRPVYAILHLDQSQCRALTRDFRAGRPQPLAHYGPVLFSGFGEPPESVLAFCRICTGG